MMLLLADLAAFLVVFVKRLPVRPHTDAVVVFALPQTS